MCVCVCVFKRVAIFNLESIIPCGTYASFSSFTPQVQRLYARYIKAESFRKALVYQKRYLLLLLGGFQECEHTTLAMVAKMGAYPSNPDLPGRHSKAFARFRTAARAVIAIRRMRFLVNRHQKIVRGELGSVSRVKSRAGTRAVHGEATELPSARSNTAMSVAPVSAHARRPAARSEDVNAGAYNFEATEPSARSNAATYVPSASVRRALWDTDSQHKDKPSSSRADHRTQNDMTKLRVKERRHNGAEGAESLRSRFPIPLSTGSSGQTDDIPSERNRPSRASHAATNNLLTEPTDGRYLPPMSPPVRDTEELWGGYDGVYDRDPFPLHSSPHSRHYPPSPIRGFTNGFGREGRPTSPLSSTTLSSSQDGVEGGDSLSTYIHNLESLQNRLAQIKANGGRKHNGGFWF